MEIVAMAASFVMSFLVPLFKNGAGGFSTELEKDLAASTANGLVKSVQRLWARLKGTPKPADEQDIVSLFERQPDVMKEALTKVVEHQLEQDEGFRKDLAALLEGEAKPGTSNWQLVGHIVGAVDARGATISGGNVAGNIYYADRTAPDRTNQD